MPALIVEPQNSSCMTADPTVPVPTAQPQGVMLYDADCRMCVACACFVLRRSHGRIRIVAQQSAEAYWLLRPHGYDPRRLESVLFLADGQLLTHEQAVLAMADALGSWPRILSRLGRRTPHSVLHRSYRWIARNRYRMFGKVRKAENDALGTGQFPCGCGC